MKHHMTLREIQACFGPRDRFGKWRYNSRLRVLTHADCPGYEIDLDTMTTSAAVLDWIFQVTAKTWVSRQDAGDFIEAIRHLVNPQATLCSFGIATGEALRSMRP